MSNFAKDLKRGAIGEQIVQKLMPHLLPLGRTADFVCPFTELTFEVKADYTNTPNFFMETFSDVEKEKLGGPWRSKKEGTDYYVYLYPEQGIGYIFTTTRLVKALEKMKNLPARSVKNRAWITKGLLVPRESLSKVYKQFTFEVPK